MNSRIILLAIGITALGSSCSTAYRSGQTPDDVYYSPARETSGYVQADRQPEREYGGASNYYEHPDDRYLRMMVRNRNRWSAFDDYGFNSWRYNSFGNPYGFASPYAYNSFYNPWGFSYFNSYWNWNNFHNPYYPGVIIVNPKTNPLEYRKVRNFSLNSYTNQNYYNNGGAPNRVVTRGTFDRYYSNPANTNSVRPSQQNTGRRLFGGNTNTRSTGKGTYYDPGSSRSYDRPSRTYTPSSSSQSSSPVRSSASPSSSSGSSGGSSGGGVSRPSRGN